MKINQALTQQTNSLLQSLKRQNEAKGPDKNSGAGSSASTTASSTALQSALLSKETGAVKMALEKVAAKGYVIDEQVVEQVKDFMQSAPGTESQKLEALDVALQKDLPMDAEVLKDIATARTTSLADYLAPQKTEATEAFKDMPSLINTKTNKSVNSPLTRAITLQIENLLDGLIDVLSTNKVDNSVNNGDKHVQNPPVVVDKSVENDKGSNLVPAQVIVTQTETQAKSLGPAVSDLALVTGTQGGKETEKDFSETLLDLIDQIESQLGDLQGTELGLEAITETLSEQLEQIVTQPQIRRILEEKVTPRILEVKESFKNAKNEIAQALSRIEQPTQALTNKERIAVLAKVVDQLDHLIMKSDVSLFLSIKQEKQLLKQSSYVEQARIALQKNQLDHAQTLVKSVAQAIENMVFKPTLQKAMALPQWPPIGTLSTAEADWQATKSAFSEGVDRFSMHEKSVGGLVNYLRRLGMNHETELFQRTFANRDAVQTSSLDKAPANLKEQLLKLSQMSLSEQSKSEVDSALSSIGGQQLHNKLVDKPQTQQLLFNIPVQQQGHVAEVKVFIQTRQNELKADYKNFDMFFVLKTQQVGEVGIRVRSVDLKLSVDVLNDHVEREALFKPLVEVLAADIADSGFTISRLGFKSWHEDQRAQKNVAADDGSDNKRTERGFDVKI